MIYLHGPEIAAGPLPGIIYFALSGFSTLYIHPYNQPAMILKDAPLRLFSWDLPYHAHDANPKEAIEQWRLEFLKGSSFLDEFLDLSIKNISFLIEQEILIADKVGVMGLSRGAFIATHLASKEDRIRSILGFAPLTHPFPEKNEIHPYSLSRLSDALTQKSLRFYIGNHDTLVGTASCFEFINGLVETCVERGVRSPAVEMIIYPSIGQKGHGTPPHIFQEGAIWSKDRLLNKPVFL